MSNPIRRVASVVGIGSVVWATVLALTGGIDVVVLGHRIRSTDPWRPSVLALIASAVFVIAGGIPAMAPVIDRVLRRLRSVPGLRRLVSPLGSAVILAAVVVAIGAAYATTVASGADGSGYVSEADRWLHGPMKPPQPWVGDVPWPNAALTFTPLGYKPVDDGPPYEQAPTYSPGLPLMMAGAKIVGGQRALFLVVPICGGIMVLAAFGIARRLRGPVAGMIAAWLTATSPLVIWMLMFPMSDVPVAAAWAVAFYFLVGEGLGSIVGAGLAAAVAILIRPNLAFLAPVMGLWFLIRLQPAPVSFARRLRDGAIFAAGVAPGVVGIAFIFDFLFGSPFVSGYGRFSDLLAAANVWPNLRLYFSWALGLQRTFVVAGLAGMLVPAGFWPRGNSRRAVIVLALMVAAVTAEYAAYLVYGSWEFLRFFLPAWPLLAVCAAAVFTTVLERVSVTPRAVLVVGLIALGANGVRTARERFAFELWHGNRRFVAAANLVRDRSSANSVVFSMEHSGALRYYSGRVPIRYDSMPPDWLDRGVDWLAASGVHSYAVLDEGEEVAAFRERFRDQRTVEALDAPIVVYESYKNGSLVYIFDLTTPPSPGTAPTVVTETDPGRWRDWPAGPAPTLSFQRPGG